MACPVSLLLSWLLLCFGDFGVLLVAGERAGERTGERVHARVKKHQSRTSTTKKWILVRHGESINNILSQDHNPIKWFREDGLHNRQDPQLSSDGLAQCTRAGKILFGEDLRTDTYNVFGGGAGFNGSIVEAVYVSPLRRAMQTALVTFGSVATEKGIPFKALPWAHEARKSKSDVGLGSSILRQFVPTQTHCLQDREPLKTLVQTLRLLPEDWSTNSSVPNAELPYYPEGKKKEKDQALQKRMTKLQEEMLRIPEDAAILVAHSGVIRHLLNIGDRKPDNVAMFYGELSAQGWNHVELLNKQEGLGDLPGFMKSKNKRGSAFDDDDKFLELGIATKNALEHYKKSPKARVWVYERMDDSNSTAVLHYFKPDKKGNIGNEKGTAHLKRDTSVYVITEDITEDRIPGGLRQFPCEDACPLKGDILQYARHVLINTPGSRPNKKCNEVGGCVMVLDRAAPEENEELPVALKIAIAAACSNHRTRDDVIDKLRTGQCDTSQTSFLQQSRGETIGMSNRLPKDSLDMN